MDEQKPDQGQNQSQSQNMSAQQAEADLNQAMAQAGLATDQPVAPTVPVAESAPATPTIPAAESVAVAAPPVAAVPNNANSKDNTLRLIAFVFAIIGIVGGGMTLGFFALMTLIGSFATTVTVNGVPTANPIMPVFSLFWLIPLIWWIPMTVHTYKIYKGSKPNTVAFGVCTILFLNLVSGILLLCSTKGK